MASERSSPGSAASEGPRLPRAVRLDSPPCFARPSYARRPLRRRLSSRAARRRNRMSRSRPAWRTPGQLSPRAEREIQPGFPRLLTASGMTMARSRVPPCPDWPRTNILSRRRSASAFPRRRGMYPRGYGCPLAACRRRGTFVPRGTRTRRRAHPAVALRRFRILQHPAPPSHASGAVNVR